MAFDPERHHRRSIRLRGYDYTQAGAYCVTVCVQGRLCLLGGVVDGEARPSPAGEMVARWWDELPKAFPGTDVDAFVVMPNHVHGIVVLGSDPEAAVGPSLGNVVVGGEGKHIGLPLPDGRGADADRIGRPASLPRMVQWFKTMSTNAYIRGVRGHGWPGFERRLWQRNYYEHIIRSDAALHRLRAYIAANPARWSEDQFHPDVPSRW